ncbi:MAG: N-formylglutamate amidohydrolase [Candidatus Cloacimonetes bacterium]|nr:N-formylglutamate amidohydrolase [Candidatus Cloacimonadota bacterium]
MLRSSVTIGNEALPLLTTAIHAGHQLPTELLKICGISEAGRLREEDPFTGEVAGLFPNHIVLETSRFAIDLNRPPEKAVYLAPEDCWGLPARTEAVPESLLARLRGDYSSWYSLLQYQIDRLLELHPFLVVLDLHSYNHRRGGLHAEPDPQEKNPDIIIGRSNLLPKHHPAADALCQRLNGQAYRDKALDCRQDVKFPGGQMSRWLNLRYPDRLICLAIEFKKTFMDEWTGELDRPAWSELKHLFYNQVRAWLAAQYGWQLHSLA